MSRKIPTLLGACAVTLAAAAIASAQMPLMRDGKTTTSSYVQTDLVTLHGGGKVPHDKQLANPWGIAFAPGTFIWISDNDTGVSTLYDATGAKQSLVVTIPPGSGQTPPSNPTGVIVNPENSFVGGNEFAGALFIFASENGTVAAWEATPSDMPTSATTVVDHSASGAVYKGLAIANDGGQDQLYVTNFNAGTVEVYDKGFNPVPAIDLAANAFTDPNATAGFAPFGIFNIGGTLFVTYAKQNATKTDEINAPGNGFIDEFAPDGTLLTTTKHFATGAPLDSPWGIVMAPATGFGPLSGTLLVGNFGDGRINGFDLATGTFVATMTDAHGHDIVNPGLWGLEFGTGDTSPNTGATNELFFTAGGSKQNKGTFGNIQFTTMSKKTGSGTPGTPGY